MKAQFDKIPELLKKICWEFCLWSRSIGVEPIITRVSDPVRGESGVHSMLRAVDFRDETSDGINLYDDNKIMDIVNSMNSKYARHDGKPTLYHHSFNGQPKHIHIQISADLETYINKGEIV